jgi:hypothetical protein
VELMSPQHLTKARMLISQCGYLFSVQEAWLPDVIAAIDETQSAHLWMWTADQQECVQNVHSWRCALVQISHRWRCSLIQGFVARM